MTDERENLPENAAVTPEGDYYEETVVEYVDNKRTRRVLAAVLVLLFLLLLSIGFFVYKITKPVGMPNGNSVPTGITWIRSLYSFGAGPEQQIYSPSDTAIAPDGTIWTLSKKRYIVGFGPDGQVRHVIVPPLGYSKGQVTSLEGIAVGDDGSVYVTDFARNVIMVFAPNGTFLREWGVQLPNVIAVRGNRLVVAAANGMGLFDTQGNLLAKWGGRGTGDTEFDLPHGVAIGPDGSIYVSDTQNRRVKAYDQSGRLLWIKADNTGTKGLMANEASSAVIGGVSQALSLPAGMTIDGAGRLLVVDPFSFEILVLDPAKKGVITARYGQEGQADGNFAYPTGIAFDGTRGTLAIADTANNRVQIIRIPGTGGSAIGRVWTSLTDTPIWLCLVPFVLLVLAIVLWMRRRRADQADADAAPAKEPLTETGPGL